jgi:multiple sugar transport system substrate-binding protein
MTRNAARKETVMHRSRRALVAFLGALVVSVLLVACGGTKSKSSGARTSIKGQTISVYIPYKIPQRLLNQFTAETGVKVNYVVIGWDANRAKLIVANTAKTYIADVAEFDWSYTGQFAAAKWVEPLDGRLPAALLKDLSPLDAAFSSGGRTYATCFYNDFRVSIYNSKIFKAAGISRFPATLDELGTVAERLKSVTKAPISIPMAATEGSVTPWYLLTLAFGGQLFDNNNKPLFAKPGSAGYKALQWEVDAVKKGWVSPGSVTLDDGPAFDKFTAGAAGMVLASGTGNLQTANDPSQSSIAGDAKIALVPGVDGPGKSFGLPEGLSIPVTAKHKDAAAAFIEWWQRPATLIAIYKSEGIPPCRGSVLKQLADRGQLEGGQVATQEVQHLVPLFPDGAPVWYSQFSSDAQGLLNAAVKGQMSVGDALDQLASKATALARGSS